MKFPMRTAVSASAVIAFVACLAAGIWLLTKVGFSRAEDTLSTAIGLYFIGKAFFVGPALWVAASQLPGGKR